MNDDIRNSREISLLINSALLLLAPIFIFAQHGKVYDHLTMKSKILKSERAYAIYLPPGYETSQRSYPVLYLLHGGGDDQTGWVQFGEVSRVADNVINCGEATAMIIVMPDANTEQRGYFNDITGKWRYEDFFFEELMPYIEKTYRIRREKHYRAVAGLSMGGRGTYVYALHHPELFSSACPLSAGTGPERLQDVKAYLKRFKKKNYENLPDSLFRSYYERNSVLYLITNVPDTTMKDVRWYIDCGDDDILYEGNSRVHIVMRKRKIPHEYRVRDGAHNWTYWRSALPDVLKFVSKAFHNF